ncbi:nuclear transport factor 2 family protein [Halopseudomonas salegens]|uniref:Ketosteroid isomerase-related protein n=1 Tax=Halopseudomonas salegens TaxID=1434072 RepID=A0A1H2GM04_9GAMM|nr:nuclear transport factor 2 family protein [Halopseudomonas salegens]SDU20610.1 Ketosteroid isomerase-related protein [Halopseudomonas salegens]
MTTTVAERFAQGFAALNKDNLSQLAELYHEDMVFTDPLHEIHGLAAMQAYCANLYANVTHIAFAFHHCQQLSDTEAVLRWTMTYQHPRLQRGQPIAVEGCSFVQFRGDKVCRHRDYFDAGALLYEHLPLLGRLIAWLKRRLA